MNKQHSLFGAKCLIYFYTLYSIYLLFCLNYLFHRSKLNSDFLICSLLLQDRSGGRGGTAGLSGWWRRFQCLTNLHVINKCISTPAPSSSSNHFSQQVVLTEWPLYILTAFSFDNLLETGWLCSSILRHLQNSHAVYNKEYSSKTLRIKFKVRTHILI